MAVLVLSGVGSVVVAAHYWSLIHAVDAVDRPVTVTAAALRLSHSGRGGTYASVSYLTPQGFEHVTLPQLGHDDDAYRAPVRVDYDARHPGMAVLASDWDYGHSTRPRVSFWVAVGVFLLVIVIIAARVLRFVLALRRTRRA